MNIQCTIRATTWYAHHWHYIWMMQATFITALDRHSLHRYLWMLTWNISATAQISISERKEKNVGSKILKIRWLYCSLFTGCVLCVVCCMRWCGVTDRGEIGSSMHALLASLRTILASLLFSIQFSAPSSGASYENHTQNIAVFQAAVLKSFLVVAPTVDNQEDTTYRTVTSDLKKTRPHCLTILTSSTQNNASFHKPTVEESWKQSCIVSKGRYYCWRSPES